MQYHNFHTHTVYSDGHDTVREMIERAVKFGFTSLGFSDHSYARAEESYCVGQDDLLKNYAEIRTAAGEYSPKIKVYAGIEQDSESALPELDYDYRLVSVHEMVRRGISLPIDSGEEKHRELVDTLFGGDYVDFAKAYFEKVVEAVMRNKTDIVGHFDLVTKYSLAPEDDEGYIRAALEAVREIVKWCPLFELNTGAIARGLREIPYPAPFILREIKSLGGRIIVTSDCHFRDKLTCWFDESEHYLTSFGFEKDENGAINERISGMRIWK